MTITIDKHKLVMYGGLLILGIVVVILIITVFKPHDESKNESKVQALDSVLKYKDQIIHEKDIQIQQKNDSIAFQFVIIKLKDSLYQLNQLNEKRHVNTYNQVPVVVRNLTKDALRREVSNFNRPE